jgi:predicted NUDIX family NTP pyrophosphohydrolase
MRQSAGILLYRGKGESLEVLLVHPGGPFWRNKDAGAWTLPKGELAEGEEARTCAVREFEEELGVASPEELVALSPVRQKGGKVVHAFAGRGDLDVNAIRSNTFRMEWPPRSGKFAEFPEVDKAAWFSPAEAREKINAAQAALIAEVERLAG